jgi:hypothetical protein
MDDMMWVLVMGPWGPLERLSKSYYNMNSVIRGICGHMPQETILIGPQEKGY